MYYRYIYAIMKTMCPPDYHNNDNYHNFVATHTLGHMMYGCVQVSKLTQSHCGDNREGSLFS